MTTLIGGLEVWTNTDPENLPLAISTLANSIAGASGTRNLKTYSVADLAALPLVTGMSTGDLSFIQEGTSLFQYSGTAWVQIIPATFATVAARNTAYAKASGAYLVAGAQSYTTDTPGVLLEYAGLYNSTTNINGRETSAGWFIVRSNIRRHFDNVINIGSTATGTNIPAGALVVRRRVYAQRIIARFAGSISGTTSGGIGLTASTGGTVTSNFGAVAVSGSGVIYAGASYIDIAAGSGTDVTISTGTIGVGPMIIGGLMTYDILLPGEYN